jgi:hypothetical protein
MNRKQAERLDGLLDGTLDQESLQSLEHALEQDEILRREMAEALWIAGLVRASQDRTLTGSDRTRRTRAGGRPPRAP